MSHTLNTIALWLIGIGCVASAGITIWKVYGARDYLVTANVPCNPSEQSCFFGDGEYLPTFYKTIVKPAYALPNCSGAAGECAPLSCAPGEPECEEILCESTEDSICTNSHEE